MPKFLPHIKSAKVFKAPKGKELKATIERVRKLCEVLDKVKSLYKDRDELILSLVNVPPKDLAKYGCLLVDNFQSEITMFKKTTAFTRYRVEWTKDEK